MGLFRKHTYYQIVKTSNDRTHIVARFLREQEAQTLVEELQKNHTDYVYQMKKM